MDRKRAKLVLLVAHLVYNQRECLFGFADDEFWVLAGQPGEEMVEGSEASRDDCRVLGAGRETQGLEKLGDAAFGHIVLLDSRLCGVDLVDFCLYRNILAQEHEQVGDLLVG